MCRVAVVRFDLRMEASVPRATFLAFMWDALRVSLMNSNPAVSREAAAEEADDASHGIPFKKSIRWPMAWEGERGKVNVEGFNFALKPRNTFEIEFFCVDSQKKKKVFF